MTKRQWEHIEDQLISAMDDIVYAIKKRSATPEEVAALPEIALALEKIGTS